MNRVQMRAVKNVVLIAQTFFMTIWGTFLTRSGMIKSVHAFAQSSIGIYFSYFMVTIACVTAALIVYRLPELRNLEIDQAATRRYRDIKGLPRGSMARYPRGHTSRSPPGFTGLSAMLALSRQGLHLGEHESGALSFARLP